MRRAISTKLGPLATVARRFGSRRHQKF